MNKEQAAEYLGITVRTLQRHMAANRIGFRGGRKTGKEATFTQADLDRFRAEQDRLTATVSPVVTPMSEDVNPVTVTPVSEGVRPGAQQALQAAFTASEVAALGPRLVDALEGLRALATGIAEKNDERPSVPIADRLTLSLAEAAQLSGLSRNHLLGAIHTKKLKARIIGRGWRMKRDDLDSYVKKL